ncbi:ATP-grasp fold amidoligase family protein [Sphingomonas sp.]|uniref:ATP-grasp fold amidoligase family protein n=1 Tax=Sphingomonas sp. TaxID=28214 RepID=UPI0035AE71D2
MTRPFNHLIAGPHFARRFGRWPLCPSNPAATINDLIFARMIEPDWPALHRRFVAKDTAKIEAQRLVPALRVPETLAVIPVAELPSPQHLWERLTPFVGTDAIAKPGHASGAATFLRPARSADDVEALHALATRDYATILREMQYWRLPKTIIVETMVPVRTSGPPDDYKFHCVHGEPLLAQVDHGRFGAPWSRLLRLPDFAPMHADDGLVTPASYTLPTPERIAAMIAAARALSAPFDFVRVDLYDGADGIYFGELTFTPAAALGIAPAGQGVHRVNPTHRLYSDTLMRALNTHPARNAQALRALV